MIKKCPICGKEFTPTKRSENHQIFCSRKCKNKRPRKNICAVCGKEFLAYSTGKKFCSAECNEKSLSKRICPICGKEFTLRHNNKRQQVFCSAVCGSHRTFENICAVCGKEFLAYSANKKFCSVECKEKYIKNYRDNLPVKVCPICGKKFKSNNTVTQIYCSGECERLFERLQYRIKNYAEKECIVCGKSFKPAVKTQIYCSKECRRKRAADRCKYLHKKVRNCVICGKEFVSYNFRQTCSKECLKELNKRHWQRIFPQCQKKIIRGEN